MADIVLHTSNDSQVTCVSNAFIDEYMRDANGEFVKIYLYLLRLLGHDELDIDISILAEQLDHTEKDVRRALTYWEKIGLVSLEYNDKDELSGICFIDPARSSSSKVEAIKSADVSPDNKKTLPPRDEYSLSKMERFKDNDDVEEMLFVIEKYLGRNLTVMDLNYIMYWVNELSFSTDLVYYLVEYCIDKGHPNIKYMDKIALDWASNDITTIEKAKDDTILHSEIYINVCKSFGINNRALTLSELEYIKKWKSYKISIEIIEEALRRTIVNTNKPNFEYADKIITNWVERSVKTIDDVKAIDEEYLREHTKTSKGNFKSAAKTSKNNKFNNFESRDYDYNNLEKMLISN